MLQNTESNTVFCKNSASDTSLRITSHKKKSTYMYIDKNKSERI